MQKTISKKSKVLKKKSKGLGDTIAKVTKVTGIDKAVKFIAGQDCGCDERKAKLNKLFPYNKPECLTETEHNYLKEFFKIHKNTITHKEQLELLKISNRVLHTKKQVSSCSSCVRALMNELKKLYDNYEFKT